MLTKKITSFNIKNINRKLFTLRHVNCIGYVNTMYTTGVLNDEHHLIIRLAASGELLNFGLLPEYAGLNTTRLTNLMQQQKLVTITYITDLIGSPSIGDIFLPSYLIDIQEI